MARGERGWRTGGRQIFLITKTGPEWQDHIEAWSNKKQAKKRADELNSTLNPNDAYDRLSQYEVAPITLLGDYLTRKGGTEYN